MAFAFMPDISAFAFDSVGQELFVRAVIGIWWVYSGHKIIGHI